MIELTDFSLPDQSQLENLYNRYRKAVETRIFQRLLLILLAVLIMLLLCNIANEWVIYSKLNFIFGLNANLNLLFFVIH